MPELVYGRLVCGDDFAPVSAYKLSQLMANLFINATEINATLCLHGILPLK